MPGDLTSNMRPRHPRRNRTASLILTVVLAIALVASTSQTAAADPAPPTPPGGGEAIHPGEPTPTGGASQARAGGFSDVRADHPFLAEITWMVERGITTGYSDGTFKSTAPVSRQAMAAFLARYANGAAQLPACTTGAFSDVPASHLFCPEITWLVENGIAQGYGDGTFRPTAPVTRQAAAAFLSRLDSPDPRDACSVAVFNDVPADHLFCREISWLVDDEIAEGYSDGTFRPTVAVSRQAAAAFLARYDARDEPTEPTPQTGWYFQPETILLAPGESGTVRLVHHDDDGLPSGATPPAVLDVLSSHPDIASVEDLGDGEARITAGTTVGATMMGAAVGDSELRIPLAVTVAKVKSTTTTIQDTSVAFPVPGDRSVGDASSTELPWHSTTGVGPFTWAELQARLDSPEAGEMDGDLAPGEDESTVTPIGVRYPIVLIDTSVADGDLLLGVEGSGLLGTAHDPITRSHEGRQFQLVTLEVTDPFEHFDEVRVDLETDDVDRAGVLPHYDDEDELTVPLEDPAPSPDVLGRSRAQADDASKNCKATLGMSAGELKAPLKVGIKPHWVSKIDGDFPVIHIEAGITGTIKGGLEFTAQVGAFFGVECELWSGGILRLPSPLPVGSFVMTKVDQSFSAVLEGKATGGPKVEAKAVCEGALTLKAGFRYNGNTGVYEDRNEFDRTFDCEREFKATTDNPAGGVPIAAEAAVGLDISSPAGVQVGGFVIDTIGKWFGKSGLGSAELLEAKFGPKVKLAWENEPQVLANEKAEATAHVEFGGSISLKSKPIVWLLSKIQGGTNPDDMSLTILEGEPLVLATFYRNLNKGTVSLEVEGHTQSNPRAALSTDDEVTVTATTKASSGLVNAPLPRVSGLEAWVKWSSGWEKLPSFTFEDSSPTSDGVEVTGSFEVSAGTCARIGPDEPVTVHLVPETDFLGPIEAFGYAGSFQLTCADPELEFMPGAIEFSVIDLMQAATNTETVRLELDRWQHTSGATGNWTWEVTSDLPEWITTSQVFGDDIMRPDLLGDLVNAEVEIRIDCGDLDEVVTHELEAEAYHDGKTDPIEASMTVTADCGDEYLGFDDGTGQPFGPTPGPFQAPTTFTLDLVSYGTDAGTWSASDGSPSAGVLPADETETFSVTFDVQDNRVPTCKWQNGFGRQYSVSAPGRGTVTVSVQFEAIPSKSESACKPPKRCTRCGGEGGMRRDPHLRTMDGINFSAQVLGEYTYLAADELHPDHDPDVDLPRFDARHEATNIVDPGAVQATSITAVALEVNGHLIEHYERPERMILVDGVQQVLGEEPFAIELEGGVEVWGRLTADSGSGGLVYLHVESDEVKLRSHGRSAAYGSYIDAFVEVDPDLPLRGLLGNFDRDSSNDLQTRDGDVIDRALVRLHSFDLYRLTDSWRVTDQSDSLFRFGYDGFHDPNHEVDLDLLTPHRDHAATLLASGAALCDDTDVDALVDSLAWELAIGSDPALLGDMMCDYVASGQVTVERDGQEYALANTEVTVSSPGLETCRTTTNLSGNYTCNLFPGLEGIEPELDPGPTLTATVAWLADPDVPVATAETTFDALAPFGGWQRTTLDILAPESAARFVDLSGSATVGGVVPPGAHVQVTLTPQRDDGAPLYANARSVSIPVEPDGTYSAAFIVPPDAARAHVSARWGSLFTSRTFQLTGTSPHQAVLDLDTDVVELSGSYTINGAPAPTGPLPVSAYPLDDGGERITWLAWSPPAAVDASGSYALRLELPEQAHGLELVFQTEGGPRTWRLDEIGAPLTVDTFDLVAESRTVRLSGTYTRDGSPAGPASLPVTLRQVDADGDLVAGTEVAAVAVVDEDGRYGFERTVPALGTGIEVEFSILGGTQVWTGNPLPLGTTEATFDMAITGVGVVFTAPTPLAPDQIRVVAHLWDGSLYDWTNLPAVVVDGVVEGTTTRYTAILPAEVATISVVQVNDGVDGTITHHRVEPVGGLADLGELRTQPEGTTRLSVTGVTTCGGCWFLDHFNMDLTMWAHDPIAGMDYELLLESELIMSDPETGEFAVDLIVPADVGDVKLVFNEAAEHGGCFTVGANTEMLVDALEGGHRVVTDVEVSGFQCI